MTIAALRRKLDTGMGRALTSALDPVISSGAMFLLQGAVLLTADKQAFGSYSLGYSYVLMGQVLLSALFGAPLVTLLGRMEGDEQRRHIGEAVLRFQMMASLVVGLLGLVLAWFAGIPASVAVAAAVGLVGVSFRDALRSVLLAQLQLVRAAVLSMIFAAAIAAILLGMFIVFRRIDAVLGLAALAAASLLAVSRYVWVSLTTKARIPAETQREIRGMTTWSLPGAIAIWLQNSFYLTLIAINLDIGAVGEVSAARMAIMPILIVTSGLIRLAQVNASRRLAGEGIAAALAGARRPALLCLLGGVVASLGCLMLGTTVLAPFVPPKFPHLAQLVSVWLLFAAATTARSIFTSLYQAMGRYRELFVYNVVMLPFVVAAIAYAPRYLGLPGAILPMAVSEIVLMAVLILRVDKADGVKTAAA
ncbi:lipopolysaccharide biosynthesis protein [Novosphingobium gossypii]|uniref:lipopolysaccharide biosynthesis protein n=1 Tax=Novosphingobium gossypii TaxID=1604774 RepID=UPI003D250C20